MPLASLHLGQTLRVDASRPSLRHLRLARHLTVVPARPTQRQLDKRAGAPQDRAFYVCVCGYAWTADVTASVGCPHCGAEQAW